MTQNKNEYAATTRPCPCYSNLPQYGADGCIKGIQAPTPVSIIPAMFRGGFRPHGIVAPHLKAATLAQQASGHHTSQNCGPYMQARNMTCGYKRPHNPQSK
jgi:hypothetical protein